MTLKIGWLHEAENDLGTWLHEADDWHAGKFACEQARSARTRRHWRLLGS